MTPLLDAILRFRQLTEDNITRAEHAAQKLHRQLGSPIWLAGVGVVVDSGRTRAAIQVSVKGGYHASDLPKHVDGIPVIVGQTKLTGSLPF